jgi:3-hydroxyisobutyrate dehydrogenase
MNHESAELRLEVDMRIALAAIGSMGTALAHRLLETGYEVRVWSPVGSFSRDALAARAVQAATFRDLLKNADVVISFFLDSSAVEEAYLGTDGFLAGSVEARLFIDMSNIDAGLHERIGPALAARSAAYIECPVSGSTTAAQSGALIGFAGGAAFDFARARPLLAQLCRHVEHLGPLGAGTRTKLAANLVLSAFRQSFGEYLLLADSAL